MPVVKPAVGDHAFLGFKVLLVEYVVAEGEEYRLAVNALGSLYDVGMVPNNKIGAVIDQPYGLLVLCLRGPIH
jgi:hypothetical protein